MEEIEGLPLVFNSEQDHLLFGKLFPEGYTFPKFPEPQMNIWREEWKTRTPEEIQQYFFPEAQVIKKNGIVVSDSTGVFKNANFSEQFEEDCPCEKDKQGNCPCQEASVMLNEVVIEEFGHPRKILGFDDIVIWFFTSSDGAKLLRAHRNLKESKSKSSNVLSVFMETSDSFNVFGSVMDFVVGDEVKKVFNNHKHWSKVVEFLERNEIKVSQKDTKKLFNQALNTETVLDYFNRLAHQLISKGSQAVFFTLADNFSLIAKGIQGFKYDDKDWDNNNPEFSSENAPFIFVNYKKYNFTSLEKVRLKNTTEIKAKFKESKDLINSYKDKFPDKIRIPLEKFIQLAEQKITLFFELFKENHSKFTALLNLGNEILNAFLCGFIDGFIDLVAFVFTFFEYAFKAIQGVTDFTVNEGFYKKLLIEYIENGIQALSKFDFLQFAKKIISLPLETLSKFVTFIRNISLPNINFTKVGYFAGYIVFGIVQIALEILFTSGSATLGRIFAKGVSIIQGGIKRVLRFGDDVFAALSHLIKQIEKGADHFAAYISKIIDDIFKWLEDLIKSGKGDEVLDSIQGNGLYGGKILSQIEIEDWARILMKKFGTKLKKVESFDNPNVLAQFDATTNTILYKDDVTEYFMAHEQFHAEEMYEIGFEAYVRDAPLKGVKEINFTKENWLRLYKREKYVYDKILKNAKAHGLNNEELQHAFQYFDYFVIYQLEMRGIRIPKI